MTTPEGILGQLEPDDLALVVTCCAMSSHRAPELLELVDPCRSSRLSQAAKGIAGLERRERISLFARHLSPPLTSAAIDTTIRALRNEPAWLAALACRSLPAQAREPLLYSAEIREAWEEKRAPHPAVESYARRLSSRLLEG